MSLLSLSQLARVYEIQHSHYTSQYCSFNYSIMACVRTSEVDEKLLTSQRGALKLCMLIDFLSLFLWQWKKKKREGRLKFIIHILFYGNNSWTVALVVRQMKSGTVKQHGRNYKFYLNYYLVWRIFKYDDGAKFWGYAGTNAEPLCVELCTLVQCKTFVNYLTC
jgi:hypothetical protein